MIILRRLLFCINLLLFRASLQADEVSSTTYTYHGEVAGVMCSVCSGHVKTALSKLPGVTSVKITAGKEGALPQLTIVSTSPGLTKESAIEALGGHAKAYTVVSLRKEAPPAKSAP